MIVSFGVVGSFGCLLVEFGSCGKSVNKRRVYCLQLQKTLLSSPRFYWFQDKSKRNGEKLLQVTFESLLVIWALDRPAAGLITVPLSGAIPLLLETNKETYSDVVPKIQFRRIIPALGLATLFLSRDAYCSVYDVSWLSLEALQTISMSIASPWRRFACLI